MHWFPMAAVANYHRVSVKTKESYSITVLETGSLKSVSLGWNWSVSRASLSTETLREKSISCLFWIVVAANISYPVKQHSGYLGPTSPCLLSSCLLFFCLSTISLCLSLMRTLEISFRIQPDNPGLSHYIYIKYIYIGVTHPNKLLGTELSNPMQGSILPGKTLLAHDTWDL